MIVLDEQLRGRDLASSIAAWYRGTVLFITELRPGTVIKDDAIPSLLHQKRQPTFVTINVADFWRRIQADRRFCIVCVALDDAQVRQIPGLLQQLFRRPLFRTKSQRMGTVIRLNPVAVSYYTWRDDTVRAL